MSSDIFDVSSLMLFYNVSYLYLVNYAHVHYDLLEVVIEKVLITRRKKIIISWSNVRRFSETDWDRWMSETEYGW